MPTHKDSLEEHDYFIEKLARALLATLELDTLQMKSDQFFTEYFDQFYPLKDDKKSKK